MKRGHLSAHFDGIGFKTLSAVEVSPDASNQHEYQAGHLKKILGDNDRKGILAKFIWLGDEQEGITDEGFVSWYDARRRHLKRSEYRLYYKGNAVTELMNEGDTFFVAMRKDGTALVIITPKGSTIERQLIWLFGLGDEPDSQFQAHVIQNNAQTLDFAARYIFDELGIEPEELEGNFLDAILEKHGWSFPNTKKFAAMVRESLTEVAARDSADGVLMAWLEREELLFRRLERHIVSDRLRKGFMAGDTADVDSFIDFSLSVQNRRKSRAGYSLEHHLEALLAARGIRYVRGAKTDAAKKPDFLFPGLLEYKDASFDASKLTMLGSKSSCKDRWTQVLTEANRITHKHLLTLEPSISEGTTNEMRSRNLQLVLPKELHSTVSANFSAPFAVECCDA